MLPGSTRRFPFPSQDSQATVLVARAHSPAVASNAPLRAPVRQQSGHGIQRQASSPALRLGPEPTVPSLALQRPASPYQFVPSQRQPSPQLGLRQQSSPVAIQRQPSLSQLASGLGLQRSSSPPQPMQQSSPTAAVRPSSTTRARSPALPLSERTLQHPSPQLGPGRVSTQHVLSPQPVVAAMPAAASDYQAGRLDTAAALERLEMVVQRVRHGAHAEGGHDAGPTRRPSDIAGPVVQKIIGGKPKGGQDGSVVLAGAAVFAPQAPLPDRTSDTQAYDSQDIPKASQDMLPSAEEEVHTLVESAGDAAAEPVGQAGEEARSRSRSRSWTSATISPSCAEEAGEEARSTLGVEEEQSSPTARPSLPNLSSPDRNVPSQSSSSTSPQNPEVLGSVSHSVQEPEPEAVDSGDFLSDSTRAPTLLPDDVWVASLPADSLAGQTSLSGSVAVPEAGTAKSGPVTGRLYRVACTFAGMEEESSQLSLMTGDLVRVHSCDPSGWIYGRLEFSSSATGRRGTTGGGIMPGTSPEGAAGWFPQALLVLDEEMAPSSEDLSGHREYHGRPVTFVELQQEFPKMDQSDLGMFWGKLKALKVDILCDASVEVQAASPSSTARHGQPTNIDADDPVDVNADADAIIQEGETTITQHLSFAAVAAAACAEEPSHRCKQELAPELALEVTALAKTKASRHAAAGRSASRERWDRSVWGPPQETLRSPPASPTRRRGLEEHKVKQCERRLASAARARRQCIGACEIAGRGRSEAENLVETAQRRLSDLEDQARKCRAQVSCAASSASSSLLHNCEAKLWTVEANVKDAVKNVLAAKKRLESERSGFVIVHDRLSAENQAAAAAVDALSKQRTKANLSIRCLAGPSGISTSASSRGSSASPLRSHGSSRAAPASQGAPPPRSGPTGRSLVRNHPSVRYLSLSPSSLRRKELERRLGLVKRYCDDGLPGPARSRERPQAAATSTSACEGSSRSRGESVDSIHSLSAGAHPNATEAELRDMLDVLKTAEALQAKLASMPEHLRTPLTKHCADLQDLMKADKVGQNSRPRAADSEAGGN